MKTFATAGAPHQPPARSVRSVMALVLVALLPGTLAQALWFGPGVLVQIVLAILFALGFEALMLRLRRQPLRIFLGDLSAPVAAILFALCIPPLAPWWIAAIGMFAAMVVAKHLYGGLGHNLFNPAMVGYAAVLICFPLELSRWSQAQFADSAVGIGDTLRAIFQALPPAAGWDAIAQPTPLDALRVAASRGQTLGEVADVDVFGHLGARGWEYVAIGHTLGGLLLLSLRIIPWQVPVALIGTVLLVSAPLHVYEPDLHVGALQQLTMGGLALTAFFIATDPVSGCTTPRGRLIFGAGVALLALSIRRWGAYPDGIAFAILLMNCAAPWIDLHTRPRIFGEQRPPQ